MKEKLDLSFQDRFGDSWCWRETFTSVRERLLVFRRSTYSLYRVIERSKAGKEEEVDECLVEQICLESVVRIKEKKKRKTAR